jgi:hypothetical protein
LRFSNGLATFLQFHLSHDSGPNASTV